MYKKILGVFLVLIMIFTLTACVKQNVKKEIGDLQYEVISPEDIKNEELINWYNDNFKIYGIHVSNENYDGKKYIIVSAGEKNTGGYLLEIDSVVGEEEIIRVNATLNSPEEGQLVTEVITYPNVLLIINDDGRDIKLGTFDIEPDTKTTEDKSEDAKKETIEKTGKYVGRIDNNSIEVSIDNEPKSFRLNDEIKQKLDNNVIKDGDNVVVVYYENEYNQLILESMEKVNQ